MNTNKELCENTTVTVTNPETSEQTEENACIYRLAKMSLLDWPTLTCIRDSIYFEQNVL